VSVGFFYNRAAGRAALGAIGSQPAVLQVRDPALEFLYIISCPKHRADAEAFEIVTLSRRWRETCMSHPSRAEPLTWERGVNKRWKTALLATTGLTMLLATEVRAANFFESSVSGSDFSDTLGGANVLTTFFPDFVFGSLPNGTDEDFFKWIGLQPGSSYQFFTGLDPFADFEALNSGGSLLPSSGLVPGDGVLVAHLTSSSSFFEGYNVRLSATQAVPAPASLALFGVGAAAALGLRRRKKIG
jgi:hypothetical protein